MGIMFKCLQCGRVSEKKHPSQKFCGKRKTGRHLCKDRYHNRIRFNAAVSEAMMRGDYDDTHPFSSDALGQWS